MMDPKHMIAFEALGWEGEDWIAREGAGFNGQTFLRVADADEGCTVGFALFEGDRLIAAFHWSED